MSENDWWNDPNAEADQTVRRSGANTAPDGEKGTDATARGALATVSPENSGTNTSAQRLPSPPHNWGSGGRPVDPFIQENPAHGASLPGITPEEAAELRKHEKNLDSRGPAEVTAAMAPPKPTAPPTVGRETDVTAETKDDKDKKELTGVKALLKAFTDKKDSAREKTGKAARAVAGATAPTRKVIGSAAHAVSPANSGQWSFLWSVGTAWSVSLQSLIALYDRVVSFVGAPQLMSGPRAMDWHLFEGPGHWFRDTLQSAWESGQAERLFFLGAIGVLPIMVAQFAERITHDGLRKAAGWIGYGVPVLWICMHSYIDRVGFRSWDELYLTGLAAASWWGFRLSRAEDTTDFQKFLLRIPLASVICGVIAYSPGAAF
jgi:hypothetical protein